MKYTEEERAFMEEIVPGHSHKEITEMFSERFRPVSVQSIKSYIANHKLNTGRTGYFEKGHIPYNKGIKGIHNSPETEFKKGHLPHNYKPVGSERVSKDGYIEIKVKDPNRWELKHRVIYEEHFGEIPKGCIVVFRNSDRLDIRIENLMLVERKNHARMNQNKLYFNDAGLTEAGYSLAKLLTAIGERENHEKRK